MSVNTPVSPQLSYEERVKQYMAQMGMGGDASSPKKPKEPGMAGTALGLAGMLGGSYATNKYLIPALKDALGKKAVEEGAKEIATQSLGQTASTAAPEALMSSSPMGLSEMQSIANGGTGFQTMSGVTPVATDAATGGTIMSDGSIAMAPGAEGGMFTAGNVLGAAAALHGGYNTYKNIMGKKGRTASAMSGAEMGAGIGTMIAPGVGTLIGAGGGALLGALGGNIKGGKSQIQMQRDALRSGVIDAGLANKDYQVSLADGSMFDIGKDGGAMLSNVGDNLGTGNKRHYYDVDFSNPLASKTVVALDPLVMSLLGPDVSQKQKSDLTGMFANAVMSNAKSFEDVQRNIGAIQSKGSGISSIPPDNTFTKIRSKTLSPGIGKDGKRIKY